MADDTFQIIGTRFYFKRDSDGSTHYPIIDLGLVSEADPQVDSTTAELRDPFRDNALADQKTVQVDRSFTFTLRDFDHDKVAFALYGISAALSVTGAQSTAVVQAAADVHAGYLLQIKDSSGDPVTRLASVDAIVLNDDSPTVEDTDWEVVDLDTGLIRIISGGLITDGEQIKVTYTTATIAGQRIAVDQATLVQGSGVFVMRGRGNSWRAKYDWARMNITPAGFALPAAEHASYQLTAAVISRPSQVGYEQGRFDIIRGA